ncbi:MAG: HSP90 family protein [Actinobacteria bacterium HGW-Actinobacteria-2]|nr:MAG: HSP90 family protein [Actinobacteria bacterium HGW-Actinobacteria-2]
MERFQVDLAGVVDLLSHHLYSGPQVYLRELLQNGVDAITARRGLDADAPATIRIVTSVAADGRPAIEVTDSGVGLTAADAQQFLSTIGNSSKRGFSVGERRGSYLGQFGIGLMAAFMVADQIEVTSRSARADEAISWVGYTDGTFTLTALPVEDRPVGTTVRLVARHGFEHWLTEQAAVELATEYGSLLPVDVAVGVAVEGAGNLWRRISEPELPWQVSYPNTAAREAALVAYCERVFRFTPMAHIDVSVPIAGLTGVVFIVPEPTGVTSAENRVYIKRMLLGARVPGVLPEWAFFMRAVLDSDLLSPTASREQLHPDEVLAATRDALGEQVKAWTMRTLSAPSALADRLLQTHHLAIRALARSDDDLLDLAASVLPYETSEGVLTLAEVAERGEVLYTVTTQAYRRVSAVARAEGITVVNAGYVYDSEILERLGTRRGWRVRELKSDDLVKVLHLLSAEREVAASSAVVRARGLLAGADCDVIARRFEPSAVPAMVLRDSEGEHRRRLSRERQAAPDLWGGLLDSLSTTGAGRSRTLVLNDAAPMVQQLLTNGGSFDDDLFAASVGSLYLSAVMMAGDGLTSSEAAQLNDALHTLLTRAVRTDEGD